MCLDLISDPVKAYASAKKTKSPKRTILVALEASALFALATVLFAAQTPLFTFTNIILIATLFLGVGLLVLITALFSGILLSRILFVLTGKGTFPDGFTVVSYSLIPVGVGAVLFALASFLPIVYAVGAFLFATCFAIGFASLYRGVRELFGTDLLTSFVALSILIVSLVVFFYAFVVLAFIVEPGILSSGVGV